MWAVVLGSFAAILLAGTATAHPLAPSLLEVRELGNGELDVRWKTPFARVPSMTAEPLLPQGCRESGPRTREATATGRDTRWRVACPAPLSGERVGVGPLAGPVTTAVVRIVLTDGRVVQSVVTPDRPFLRVPERPRRWDVARDYGRLGVSHILHGPDHLLFVFGLVLLSVTARAVAAAVTAFTAGHSLTLAAAVLGLVRVPVGPIEVAIAASVFVLAVELARDPTRPTLIRSFPWVMAFVFGLLHGLGFAAALGEAGLPAGEVPLALATFNLGVEVGQMLFVAGVLVLVAALAPLGARGPGWLRRAPVYVMGSLAALWWIERAAAWVGTLPPP
jgi:hydrogenase/urease accessory protein HupE